MLEWLADQPKPRVNVEAWRRQREHRHPGRPLPGWQLVGGQFAWALMTIMDGEVRP